MRELHEHCQSRARHAGHGHKGARRKLRRGRENASCALVCSESQSPTQTSGRWLPTLPTSTGQVAELLASAQRGACARTQATRDGQGSLVGVGVLVDHGGEGHLYADEQVLHRRDTGLFLHRTRNRPEQERKAMARWARATSGLTRS